MTVRSDGEFVIRPLSFAEQAILGQAAEINGKIANARVIFGENPSYTEVQRHVRAMSDLVKGSMKVVLIGQGLLGPLIMEFVPTAPAPTEGRTRA